MTPIEAIIAVLELVSSLSLGLLSARLLRLQRILGGSLDAPLGFALLALSQLSGALSVVAQGRASYTLYVATSALASAGFASLQAGSTGTRKKALAVSPITIPVSVDLAAFLVAGWATARFRGAARALVGLVSVSYALRAVGLLLIPSPIGMLVFSAGETARAVILTILSLIYIPR